MTWCHPQTHLPTPAPPSHSNCPTNPLRTQWTWNTPPIPATPPPSHKSSLTTISSLTWLSLQSPRKLDDEPVQKRSLSEKRERKLPRKSEGKHLLQRQPRNMEITQTLTTTPADTKDTQKWRRMSLVHLHTHSTLGSVAIKTRLSPIIITHLWVWPDGVGGRHPPLEVGVVLSKVIILPWIWICYPVWQPALIITTLIPLIRRLEFWFSESNTSQFLNLIKKHNKI